MRRGEEVNAEVDQRNERVAENEVGQETGKEDEVAAETGNARTKRKKANRLPQKVERVLKEERSQLNKSQKWKEIMVVIIRIMRTDRMTTRGRKKGNMGITEWE